MRHTQKHSVPKRHVSKRHVSTRHVSTRRVETPRWLGTEEGLSFKEDFLVNIRKDLSVKILRDLLVARSRTKMAAATNKDGKGRRPRPNEASRRCMAAMVSPVKKNLRQTLSKF